MGKTAEMEQLKIIRQLVLKQVDDYGLWFIPTTAPEAYLQQELREIHRVVEEYLVIKGVL